MKTEDIRQEFIHKYLNNEFRYIGNDVQETKTIEIQNAHFEVDKPYIIREPNYDYFFRELQWYNGISLNVNDIPGGAPKMWKACADKDGFINSNYGWCIFSEENGNQYVNCLIKLQKDPHTREAIMIYNRPSMHCDAFKNGRHDFMCCQNMQYFINERNDNTYLDCIVNFRSNDAVFGFNNDSLWAKWVQQKLAKELGIQCGKTYWNAGSLHIYERHFKVLEDSIKNS